MHNSTSSEVLKCFLNQAILLAITSFFILVGRRCHLDINRVPSILQFLFRKSYNNINALLKINLLTSFSKFQYVRLGIMCGMLYNSDTSTWPRITYPIRIRVSVSDTPIHLCAFKFCRNLTYPRIRIGPILIRLSVSVLHSYTEVIQITSYNW